MQLLVRLGAATSAEHLKRVLGKPGVQVRYFTDQSFHSKLYIFGAACALVGSANLTASGMTTNQKIVVALGPDDPRFDKLVLEELKNRSDRKSRMKLITIVTIRIAYAQARACSIRAWTRRRFQKNKRAGPIVKKQSMGF